MKVLILYNSRTGHTRKVAQAISKITREQHHQATVKSIVEVKTADVTNSDVLFVGTWVQGFILFGVKPAEARLWVPALPALNGKPVGIFCTYAFNPRDSMQQFSDLLAAQGATVVAEKTVHRSRLTDGLEPFVKRVLQSVPAKTP